MKKIKFFKFISAMVINYFILGLISFAISQFYSFTFKDTSFIIGLVVFMFELCINISGNPFGLSLQSLGQINSQYVSNVDFKAFQHEDALKRSNVNIKTLINSTLLFSSILILITSYYI